MFWKIVSKEIALWRKMYSLISHQLFSRNAERVEKERAIRA